jgi:iron complex outermembrane receptor protein
MHPIFQWLDYQYNDYGAFARLSDESRIGGFANRLVIGANLHDGTIGTRQYVNNGGEKGAPTVNTDDTARNFTAYAENHFYIVSGVALVAGTQFLHAERERDAHFGAVSGETDFNLWSPKGGIVWDVDRRWQVFANVSRSAEVPSFGEGVSGPAFLGLPSIPFTDIKPQRATTYEIGTRGTREDYSWDLAAYRADIDDELMCFYSAFGNCNVSNADKTVHQGLEIGFGVAVVQSIFVEGDRPDKVWLQTAYTFNDFFFDDDATFGDNALPGAPRHLLTAELLYKHPSGFYLGPNVEWVPEAYYADSANTLKTDAYAIWGAKIGFDNGGPVTAYLEGRNLSDTAYIASTSIIDRAAADSPLFEPGTGRAVYGGVQVKW